MKLKAVAKKPHIYARVQKDGSFVCADEAGRAILRKRKIKRGQLVRLVVSKERDYGQWKKAHRLGQLIAENFDEFHGLEAHEAIKKLQRLSGVECDGTDIEVPGIGKLVVRLPRSLAFDEMDEAAFQAAYSGFCQYIVETWWHDLDEAQIEQMASLVGMGS